MDKTQEEIQQLERQQLDDAPDLFKRGNPGVNALRDRLKHLRGVAEDIKRKIQSIGK
jgi:hypothetical protein